MMLSLLLLIDTVFGAAVKCPATADKTFTLPDKGYAFAQKSAAEGVDTAKCSADGKFTAAKAATKEAVAYTAAEVATAMNEADPNTAISQLKCAENYEGTAKAACTSAGALEVTGCTLNAKCDKLDSGDNNNAIPQTASGSKSAAVDCKGKYQSGKDTRLCTKGTFGATSCKAAKWAWEDCPIPTCDNADKELSPTWQTGVDKAAGTNEPAKFKCIKANADNKDACETAFKELKCDEAKIFTLAGAAMAGTEAGCKKAKDAKIGDKVGDCECKKTCGTKTRNGPNYTCKLYTDVTAAWDCPKKKETPAGGSASTVSFVVASVFSVVAALL